MPAHSINKVPNPPANPRGWILYDGDCRLCRDLVARFGPSANRVGFALLPLQFETGRQLLPDRDDENLLREMTVVTREGKTLGGAHACLFLAKHFRWTRPLGVFAILPGGPRICAALYRWIAARRHCYSGACTVNRPVAPALLRLAAAVLPVATFAITRNLEPWILMWALAGAIFFACKFLMLARPRATRIAPAKIAIYLFLWPGMDPRPFRHGAVRPRRPRTREWLAPAAKLAAGLFLLRIAIPAAETTPSLAVGWLGMTGILLVLHFALFHGLALFWQRKGIPVLPLMNAPFRAASLAEFWGGRWNRGFSDLARDLIYHPLWRRIGPAACTMLVFLISGIVHDLVISVPARGGYGLPTLFFLIQGFGLLAERSHWGKRAKLGQGARGRILTAAVLGAPLFWLFHPAFVDQVIIPFLQTIATL